jgi:hypothetical protein
MDAQERESKDQEQSHDGNAGEDGMAHHRCGNSAPERRLGTAEPVSVPYRSGVHLGTEQRQDRRKDEERGSGGHNDDADACVRERAQEIHREHEQYRQRHRHCRSGEHDGAPGCGYAAPDGGLRPQTSGKFLSVSGDHEQGVVDTKPQAERRGQIESVDTHCGQASNHIENGQRRNDGKESNSDGQQSSDNRTESQD